MIIGTWAEWFYTDYFEQIAGVGEVHVDIGKTHDIDVYFRNYLMEIDGAERLKDDLRGARPRFSPSASRLSPTGGSAIRTRLAASTVQGPPPVQALR